MQIVVAHMPKPQMGKLSTICLFVMGFAGESGFVRSIIYILAYHSVNMLDL